MAAHVQHDTTMREKSELIEGTTRGGQDRRSREDEQKGGLKNIFKNAMGVLGRASLYDSGCILVSPGISAPNRLYM